MWLLWLSNSVTLVTEWQCDSCDWVTAWHVWQFDSLTVWHSVKHLSQGDSGGPLTYKKGGQHVLIGIITGGWGGCGESGKPSEKKIYKINGRLVIIFIQAKVKVWGGNFHSFYIFSALMASLRSLWDPHEAGCSFCHGVFLFFSFFLYTHFYRSRSKES